MKSRRRFRRRGRSGAAGRADRRAVCPRHEPACLGRDLAGLPRRLVDGAKAGGFEPCTSEVLLAELLDVLSRGKFATRLAQAGLTPQSIVDDLRRIAVVVTPADTPRVVPTDPDDDHVIAAALAGQADLIASGDKRDLLPMGSYAGIRIVTAREALERLESRREF